MSFFRDPNKAIAAPVATTKQVNELASNILRIQEVKKPKSFAISLPETPKLTHYASFTADNSIKAHISLYRNMQGNSWSSIILDVWEHLEPDYLDSEQLSVYTMYSLLTNAISAKKYQGHVLRSEFRRLTRDESPLAQSGPMGRLLLDGPVGEAQGSKDLKTLNSMFGLARLTTERCAELMQITSEFDPELAATHPNAVR